MRLETRSAAIFDIFCVVSVVFVGIMLPPPAAFIMRICNFYFLTLCARRLIENTNHNRVFDL